MARFHFLFFKPSSLICPETSVVLGLEALLTAVSVKMAVALLLFLHSYCLLAV
jgi:hypothetical protein